MADQKIDNQKKKDDISQEIEHFISFLKDPSSRRELQSFFINLYKSIEKEGVERFVNRLLHEKKSDENHSTSIHQSSNVTPLTDKDLSMAKTEKVFAESLARVKEFLENRVEEDAKRIEDLLNKHDGGFASQIRSDYAHTSISFLETASKNKHRQELNYALNIPQQDLLGEWDKDSLAAWDMVVDVSMQALEACGLKAEYVRNDRNSRSLVLKQQMLKGEIIPDEYFSIMIDFRTAQDNAEDGRKYNEALESHNSIIAKLRKKLEKLEASQDKTKKDMAQFNLNEAIKEKEHFSAISPNPNEMSEGLMVYVQATTTSDYNLTRKQIRKFIELFVETLSKNSEKVQEYEVDLNDLRPIDRKKNA